MANIGDRPWSPRQGRHSSPLQCHHSAIDDIRQRLTSVLIQSLLDSHFGEKRVLASARVVPIDLSAEQYEVTGARLYHASMRQFLVIIARYRRAPWTIDTLTPIKSMAYSWQLYPNDTRSNEFPMLFSYLQEKS